MVCSETIYKFIAVKFEGFITIFGQYTPSDYKALLSFVLASLLCGGFVQDGQMR